MNDIRLTPNKDLTPEPINKDDLAKEDRKASDFPFQNEAEAIQKRQDNDSKESYNNITSRHAKLDEDIAHGFAPDRDGYKSLGEKDAVDFHKIYPNDKPYAQILIEETKAKSPEYELAFKKTLLAEQTKPQEYNQRLEAEKIASSAPSQIEITRKEQTPKEQGNIIENDDYFSAYSDKNMPETITTKYIQAGNSYHLETAKTKEPVFVDKGDKLETSSSNEQVAYDLVQIAAARGWTDIKVKGTDEFKSQVWLDASKKGIEVKGYTPNDLDKAKLASSIEKEKSAGITIEKGETKAEVINSIERLEHKGNNPASRDYVNPATKATLIHHAEKEYKQESGNELDISL
jgi:hypothetical protein